MKSDFISIMETDEYKAYHNFINQMVKKMKDENFTFKNREDFVAWINKPENLGKTYFDSTDEAIKLYDNSMTALVKLHSKFNTFYENLLTSNTDEFSEICAPEMVHPKLPLSKKSCVIDCVDTAENDFHIADITYEYAMNTGDFGMIMGGTIAYNAENAHITQNYINCFGSCPV